MQEGRPRESLVLHDTPIEIGPASDPSDPFKKSFGTSKRKGQLPPMENRPKQEDILNAILPPREWVENGKCSFCNRSNLNLTRDSSAQASTGSST